jgi:type VI secretion system protein ImpL
MNDPSPLPAIYWPLLALCLLGFVALWWFAQGSKRFARRRLLRQRIDVLGPAPDSSEHVALAEMLQAIARARHTLQHVPAPHAVRAPLYDIPWILFIGDRRADVRGLLAAAHRASPRQAQAQPGPDHEPFWRWWLLRSITAIETSPAAVCDPAARHERSLWYQALMALAEERDRLPLNGIVVCVSAPSLLDSAEALEADAARLRRLVDEAAELLLLQLPVYLVVTGLEQLSGWDAVRAALPSEVLGQALGHRLADHAPPAIATGSRFDALFASITQRLDALRMALQRGQQAPGRRLAIHAFVEQVHALQPGLRLLVDRMFDNGRDLRAPRWRGLYLAAAPSDDGDSSAFVADLFQRFLPADQPLARS